MTSISNIWKQVTSILWNQNNFHSLEVVDRVSETQLHVGDNSDWIIWRLKGWGALEESMARNFKWVGITQIWRDGSLLSMKSNFSLCATGKASTMSKGIQQFNLIANICRSRCLDRHFVPNNSNQFKFKLYIYFTNKMGWEKLVFCYVTYLITWPRLFWQQQTFHC